MKELNEQLSQFKSQKEQTEIQLNEKLHVSSNKQSELSKEKGKLETELKNKNSLVQTLQKETKTEEESIKGLKNDLAHEKKALTEIKKAKESVDKQLTAQFSQQSLAQSRVSQLEADLNINKKKATDADAMVKEANKALDHLKQEIESKTKEADKKDAEAYKLEH